MIPFVNQTVEAFFQEANWQGLKLVPRDNHIASSAQKTKWIKAHLGLTVEQYFILNNWQGIAISSTNNYEEEILEEQVDANVYSLKMSVGKFFQRMIWQKRTVKSSPKITSPLPNSNSASFKPLTKQQFNFEDLSDLM